MTVYVDTMEAPFGRMKMCHMFADTLAELNHMADAIGVARKWIQHPPKASWVHYDIALNKKKLAIKHGAVLIEWRDILDYAWAQHFQDDFLMLDTRRDIPL